MRKSRADPILLKAISYNIKKIRKKLYDSGRKSFTQKGCADKVSVKQQDWNRWESGKTLPSPANQRKIAELLEVSLAELRGEALPPPPVSEGMDTRFADALHWAAIIRYNLDAAQEFVLHDKLSAEDFAKLTESLIDVLESHLVAHGKNLNRFDATEAV